VRNERDTRLNLDGLVAGDATQSGDALDAGAALEKLEQSVETAVGVGIAAQVVIRDREDQTLCYLKTAVLPKVLFRNRSRLSKARSCRSLVNSLIAGIDTRSKG
jgi:hypothetical protein